MKEELCERGGRDLAGKRSGWVGLFGNLLLVAAKALAGILSNSVAVTADAMNNLADCVSSLVTLLGFSLATKGRDQMHPYGHGRMEYVCGFVVSLLIILTGLSVGKDAVGRLAAPQQVAVTGLTAAVLCLGVLGKAAMACYVRYLNKAVGSPALDAVQLDNWSDALVTAFTLAGILAAPYPSLPVDGLLGVAVAAVILRSGASSFKENLVLLLGEGADPDTEDEMVRIVTEYIPGSVEEISLHDYGPENRLAYIKIDRPAADEGSIAQALSCIKEKIRQELQIDATLYWDSVN